MEITREQMIGQGNTAEIYRLDDNKILKLFRNGLYKGIIEKEYQNGIIIQNVLNCVPKVYEMVEINGRHGIIYEEVQGKDMLKIMLSSFWKINYYAKELAHYHLSIQLPVKEPLTTVKEKLEADLQNVDMLSDKNKEYIRKYLSQLPDGNMLCHFDFHPGNVMIARDKKFERKSLLNYLLKPIHFLNKSSKSERHGYKFILDWMTACSGDACADIARTCIMLKYGEVAHAPFLVRKIFSLIQHHIYRLYIKEYLKISYRSIDDINRWELPVAAARLREWISDNEKKKLLRLVNKWCNKSDLTT